MDPKNELENDNIDADVDDTLVIDDLEEEVAEPEEPKEDDKPAVAEDSEDDVSPPHEDLRPVVDSQAQELAELRRWRKEVEKREQEAATTSAQRTLDEKMATARQRLRNAVDDVDPDEQVAAMEELVDLRSQAAEAKRIASQPAREQPIQREQPVVQVTAAERKWQEKNPWFFSQQKAREQTMAGQIYHQLVSEGDDPRDGAFYDELDRRLHRRMPHLKATDTPTEKPPPPKQTGTLMGGSSRDGGGRDKPSQPRRLTEADLKSMKQYGFDPQDADDRKAWKERNAPL